VRKHRLFPFRSDLLPDGLTFTGENHYEAARLTRHRIGSAVADL
jgi:hypothetical protein